MGTWNSRGLRGSTLEEMVNWTNDQYLEKGLALMQKIPTPLHRCVWTQNTNRSHWRILKNEVR